MTNVGCMRRNQRKGAVLLLVLVIVPLLALGAYAFTHAMRAEAKASQVALRQGQARWLAESGVDWVRSQLMDTANADGESLRDNASLFAAQTVFTDSRGDRGMFSILSRPAVSAASQSPFGLESESTKIPLDNQNLRLTRERMMGLPSMNEGIADAILDWIDSDDSALEQGAESSYYLSLNPPYRPRNGTPLSVDELLLVKGVTPALLYGEDINLDGILNPNENDGGQSYPEDNADGKLDRGWMVYFTLSNGGSNQNAKGDTRTYLNVKDDDDNAIKTLANRLSELFGAELAEFVITYKRGKSLGSITELINAQTVLPGEGGQPPTPLRSPWTLENLDSFLDTALDELTTVEATVSKGRIDVNRAPAEVLQCIPGINTELAQKIADAASGHAQDTSYGWLLKEKILTLAQFRQIENYVTARGRIFRFESVGYFSNGGPVVRLEVTIDATGDIPIVTQKRELTPLGQGYTVDFLTGAGS